MLSGDDVADVSWGNSICSRDALAPYLAKELKATRMLFASDVDGIFDQNPQKYKNAKLISKVNKQNFSEVISSVTRSSHIDVTEGMKGKLLEIKRCSCPKETKIIIFNGLRKRSVFEALTKNQIGTVIDLA